MPLTAASPAANARYGPGHVDPATRTASVDVASSWSASRTNARSRTRASCGGGSGCHAAASRAATEPADGTLRAGRVRSTSGATPRSRRAAAGGSSEPCCAPSPPATATSVPTSLTPTAAAIRAAIRTSRGSGSGHSVAAGSSPVHSSSATCSNVAVRARSATSRPKYVTPASSSTVIAVAICTSSDGRGEESRWRTRPASDSTSSTAYSDVRPSTATRRLMRPRLT